MRGGDENDAEEDELSGCAVKRREVYEASAVKLQNNNVRNPPPPKPPFPLIVA